MQIGSRSEAGGGVPHHWSHSVAVFPVICWRVGSCISTWGLSSGPCRCECRSRCSSPSLCSHWCSIRYVVIFGKMVRFILSIFDMSSNCRFYYNTYIIVDFLFKITINDYSLITCDIHEAWPLNLNITTSPQINKYHVPVTSIYFSPN